MQATAQLLGTHAGVLPARRVAYPSRPAQAHRRGGLVTRGALIGEVNDPERSKEQKESKSKDSHWGEPKNKNPLEKKTIEHGGSEGIPEAKEAGKKVQETLDKAKEAVKGVTQQN